MKRLILLCSALVILGSQSVYSQDADFPFQFGFKVSPNIGWIRPNSDSYSYDGMVPGFNWGIVGEYNLTESYGIVSGITFVSTGGKLVYPYKIGGEQGRLHRHYKLRFIEVPILLKMQTREIGPVRYFMQVGLGTAIRYNAKAKDEYHAEVPDPLVYTKEPEINGDIRFVRESLIIGAGVRYPVSGTTVIIAGVNFSNGFTNILKGRNSADSDISQKAYPNCLELNLGVLF